MVFNVVYHHHHVEFAEANQVLIWKDVLGLHCPKQIYDAYKKPPFPFKCEVISYILDYPGIGKVFNVLGSGTY